MQISFGTRINKLESINKHNGYGYATDNMLNSLHRLGYQVSVNDASADVEIWFDQPHHWKFSDGPYKIGYHPWESTQLQPGWAEIMNQCDEIWTPSPLIAHWYRKFSGIKVPVYVYEHGVDHQAWAPIKREPTDTLKYLHVGAEAARKGGWDTVRAFRRALPTSADATLTLKMVESNWNGFSNLGRVSFIDEKYEFNDLVKLFLDHDVYVYPSFGEGFGLTPLQAMSTGMPTITLPGWAPYRRFLDPRLAVHHKVEDSPWPKIHPGKMLAPQIHDVVTSIKYAYDNYESCRDFALEQSEKIHKYYDWDTLTNKAFSDLAKRLK